jgi:hypothetical protein
MKKRIFMVEKTTANPLIPWGGRHITIMGYHFDNNRMKFKDLIKGSIFEKKMRWTISSTSGAILQKWKDNWTIVINHSETFSKFSDHLVNKGCKNVKGPVYSQTKWHITLPGYSKRQAEKYLEDCLNHKIYYYVVESIEKDGKFTYNKL